MAGAAVGAVAVAAAPVVAVGVGVGILYKGIKSYCKVNLSTFLLIVLGPAK